ncbi:MAG: hypothetical protein FJ100_06585 [Deltaproteobacteria bacterium]|nr:hypothetical protein [Deltaproteobacteria bacterium]
MTRPPLFAPRAFAMAGAVCLCANAVPAPVQALSKMASSVLCADLPAAEGDAEAGKRALGEAEALFAARGDAAKAEAGLEAFDKALAADPGNAAARIKAARLYYLVADGYHRFAGESKEPAMIAGFERGMAHAAAALAVTSPVLKRKICSGAPMADVVASLDERAVEPIYWFCTHMGKYGLAKDLLEVLSNKDLIFAVMAKLQAIKPDYFHFAPDRYLGGYYTKVPFPDGDLARSFAHFSASIKGAPNYLATYTLMAEMYVIRAVNKVDPRARVCAIGAKKIADDAPDPAVHPCRTLFESLLATVKNAKPDAVPDLAAEMAVEKRKAEALLKDVDTYFPAP